MTLESLKNEYIVLQEQNLVSYKNALDSIAALHTILVQLKLRYLQQAWKSDSLTIQNDIIIILHAIDISDFVNAIVEAGNHLKKIHYSRSPYSDKIKYSKLIAFISTINPIQLKNKFSDNFIPKAAYDLLAQEKCLENLMNFQKDIHSLKVELSEIVVFLENFINTVQSKTLSETVVAEWRSIPKKCDAHLSAIVGHEALYYLSSTMHTYIESFNELHTVCAKNPALFANIEMILKQHHDYLKRNKVTGRKDSQFDKAVFNVIDTAYKNHARHIKEFKFDEQKNIIKTGIIPEKHLQDLVASNQNLIDKIQTFLELYLQDISPLLENGGDIKCDNPVEIQGNDVQSAGDLFEVIIGQNVKINADDIFKVLKALRSITPQLTLTVEGLISKRQQASKVTALLSEDKQDHLEVEGDKKILHASRLFYINILFIQFSFNYGIKDSVDIILKYQQMYRLKNKRQGKKLQAKIFLDTISKIAENFVLMLDMPESKSMIPEHIYTFLSKLRKVRNFFYHYKDEKSSQRSVNKIFRKKAFRQLMREIIESYSKLCLFFRACYSIQDISKLSLPDFYRDNLIEITAKFDLLINILESRLTIRDRLYQIKKIEEKLLKENDKTPSSRNAAKIELLEKQLGQFVRQLPDIPHIAGFQPHPKYSADNHAIDIIPPNMYSFFSKAIAHRGNLAHGALIPNLTDIDIMDGMAENRSEIMQILQNN